MLEVLGTIFGSIFSGGESTERARIPVAVIDQDDSAISRGIVSAAREDKYVAVTTPTADEAREAVTKGGITVAVIIPKGFGDAAGRAFFAGVEKPQLTMWYDPSHSMELGLVRGILTEHVMQAVSAEMLTGVQGKKLVDETLAQLGAAGQATQQQALLRDLLQSARKFYDEPHRFSLAMQDEAFAWLGEKL